MRWEDLRALWSEQCNRQKRAVLVISSGASRHVGNELASLGAFLLGVHTIVSSVNLRRHNVFTRGFS